MNFSIRMPGGALLIMAVAIAIPLSPHLRADTLVLKNGQLINGKTFIRQGNAIIATTGPAGEPLNAGAGTPLGEIVKVECDPPPVFKTASQQLAVGKAAAALEDVEAALKSAEAFGDLPGSRWPDLLVLRAHIVLSMGKDDEAATLAKEMKATKNAALVRNAQVLFALIEARKGDHDKAAYLLDPLLHEPASPGMMAAAAVIRGLGLLSKQQYPEALKSFLELPVFLPDETAFSGIAQLGAAQAYYGMEDYDRAIAALESLIKTRPETPEVVTAQSLLPEWKRRRRVVEEAKEP
jgi:tetratricopeptide (TPR) repeat protein